jgi:hypothetical protein
LLNQFFGYFYNLNLSVAKSTMNFKYILTAAFVLSNTIVFADGSAPPPPPGPTPPGLPIDFGLPVMLVLGILIVFARLYNKNIKKLPN